MEKQKIRMTEERKTGKFSWYNNLQGYGVIQAVSGSEFFAHQSNLVDLTDPQKGQEVSFLVRSRPKNKSGFEAYDIRIHIRIPAQPPAANSTTIDETALQRAAQEALRLKRERRDGKVTTVVEDKPVGRRVYHPEHGYGSVVQVSRDILSIRLEKDWRTIVDVNREDLSSGQVRLEEVPAPQVRPAQSPQQSTVKGIGSTLAGMIKKMASDAREVLTKEGLEAGEIYRHEEASEPASPSIPLEMDARVIEAFSKTSSIENFYSHQVAARQGLLQGQNVLLATPTASGKTEAYNPTILEHLLNHPEATALYLFPLVALGFDQTERLQKLNQALPASDQLQIGILNNNVPASEKLQTLKQRNRILVTTPETLHYIILPKNYSNWRTFFKNLRFIVVDEAHLYKGVFGANMANILRRLLARCRREGNPNFPQMIISSATIRHPHRLANQLSGLPEETFKVITESGAPRQAKHLLVTRSDIHEVEEICAELLDISTRRVGESQTRPVSMIVFLRSISETKRVTRNIREYLRKHGREFQAAMVEEFYSDKADKTDILLKLKKGEIRCICTTNALMAGIDIGALDIAIVKNFPRLLMDARQMFGRAGRSGEGAVIFIADRNNPFDQFYFEKPELLFNGPTEDVVAKPENPILLGAHLQCAAQVIHRYDCEGPLSGEWMHLFGQMGRDIIDRFIQDGVFRIQAGQYYLESKHNPHDSEPLKNIRAMNGETYALRDTEGQLLEEKRTETAYRDAHRDAIVLMNGQAYQVTEFSTDTHEITCQLLTESRVRTQGIQEQTLKVLSIDPVRQRQEVGDFLIQSGDVEVTTSVNSYIVYKNQLVMQCRNRKCRYETPNLDIRRCPKCNSPVRQKNIEKADGTFEIPTPPHLQRTLKTHSVWLNLPQRLLDRYLLDFWPIWKSHRSKNGESEAQESPFNLAVHSIEHAILKAFPENIRCDPDEIAGYFEMNTQGYAARLFIYDNFPGGLGLSDELSYDPLPILKGALDGIERCTCIDDVGCPICLSYFGCQTFNQSLSKMAGRYLLRTALGVSTSKVLNDLNDSIYYQISTSHG